MHTIMTLSPESLRVALAELMGYQWFKAKTQDDLYTLSPNHFTDKYWQRSERPENYLTLIGCVNQCPLLDDNFLRVCREKLLTTKELQEEFLRQLGFELCKQAHPENEMGLPSDYDFLNASVEQQATVLVKMFSTKTPITGE